MLEQEKLPENGEMPGDDLLKVVVDKVIDNGMLIRGIGDQLRKVLVQNEGLEEMQMKIERMLQGNESLVKSVEQYRKGMENGFLSLKDKIDAPEVLAEMKKIRDRVWQDTSQLRESMEKHRNYFEEPHTKVVRKEYAVSRSLLACGGMALLMLFFCVLWTMAEYKAIDRKEYEIKWRALRVMSITGLPEILDSVDHGYSANPGQYTEDIEADEQRLNELRDRIIHGRANQQRIDELEKPNK